MNKEEYIINELGIEIARENAAKLMRKIMQEKDKEIMKIKINKLLQDIDKIEKGDLETINKYMEEKNIG